MYISFCRERLETAVVMGHLRDFLRVSPGNQVDKSKPVGPGITQMPFYISRNYNDKVNKLTFLQEGSQNPKENLKLVYKEGFSVRPEELSQSRIPSCEVM